MKLERDVFIEMWKKHLAEQEEYMHEMRSLKHDMQGHLIVLQYYLESGKHEAAKCYIKEIRQNLDKVSNGVQIDLGNELVNVVVKECIVQSTFEINFESNGKIPDKINMNDYDLCTIFYNLVKNAVEACEKLSTYEKRISIELIERKDCLEIVIKNPKEWEVSEEILGRSTTKENKSEHGYGIKNVMKTVSKYKGEVDFVVLGNAFAVKISLPK